MSLEKQVNRVRREVLKLVAIAAFCGATLAGAVAPAAAQGHVDLTGFGGYLWGGTVNVAGGDIHANASPEWGGILSVEVRPGYYGELQYWYQGADLLLRLHGDPAIGIGDLSTHYILFAGTRDLGYGDTQATPFVTGGLGMVIYDLSQGPPGVSGGSSAALFMLGGGVRVDLNEKLAIRTQVRLLLPTRIWSSGVWFGTGGGGYSVSGTSIAQGDANIGLTFKLGS